MEVIDKNIKPYYKPSNIKLSHFISLNPNIFTFKIYSIKKDYIYISINENPCDFNENKCLNFIEKSSDYLNIKSINDDGEYLYEVSGILKYLLYKVITNESSSINPDGYLIDVLEDYLTDKTFISYGNGKLEVVD